MKRVGFLFNHDQGHQVAHSLPIALDLISRNAAHVTLIVTNQLMAHMVEEIAGALLGQADYIRLAPESFGSRLAVKLLDRIVPASKLSIYRDHLNLFRSFDALVVSEKSSLLLKSRYGLTDLKMIHTRHGAGDRAIGFNRESADFDLILVSGPKIRDRLVFEAKVPEQNIAIVGYCKFDHYLQSTKQADLFGNGRPTILYNPHPSPKLSSWYAWGDAILQHFASQEKYNLIFAPHVMLFERGWTITVDPPALARVRKPDKSYRNMAHIHIDLGSGASSDMTYTNAAHLYLGDVSSQVYEFLADPRPCLFLNAHNVSWENDPNYKQWHAGPVIESIDMLGEAIDNAFDGFSNFQASQQAMIDETFSITAVPAARRAAEAILDMLHTNESRTKP